MKNLKNVVTNLKKEEVKMKSLKELVKRGVVTHSGKYHADDVISACMLKITGIIANYQEIQREANVPEGFKGLVFDLGGGEFDHHQVDCKKHTDGSRYAACTLLAEKLFSYNVNQELYYSLLKGIELTDNNGQEKYPNYYCKVVDVAYNFKKSFTEVCEGLQDIIELYIIKAENDDVSDIPTIRNEFTENILKQYAEYEKIENQKVEEFINKNKGEKIAILNEHLPAHKMKESSLILVIEKSLRGGYNVTVVANKITIPQEVENWDGFIFVHQKGFIAGFNTLQNALSAAKKLVK